QPLLDDRVPRRIDLVIHTAGLVGQPANASPLCRRVNVEATRELVDYPVHAQAKRFIFFSTGGVYRPTEQRPTQQSAVAPPDAYTRSKLAAERVAQRRAGKLVVQILRLFFPFGPTQQGRLVANLIENIAHDQPVRLTNRLGQPLVTPLY